MRFTFLLLILWPGLAMAQIHRAHTRPEPVWEYIIKGGWQFTSFANSAAAASFGSGWNAGVALKMPVKRAFWVLPEINYSKRSATLQYPAQQSSTLAAEVAHRFTYVSYSLLLAYRPNDILEFHVGPQFGALLGYEVKPTDVQQVYSLTPGDLNNWEYAAAAGIELNVSPLVFGARYAYSLRDIARTMQAIEVMGDARLHGLQLYGALVF